MKHNPIPVYLQVAIDRFEAGTADEHDREVIADYYDNYAKGK